MGFALGRHVMQRQVLGVEDQMWIAIHESQVNDKGLELEAASQMKALFGFQTRFILGNKQRGTSDARLDAPPLQRSARMSTSQRPP